MSMQFPKPPEGRKFYGSVTVSERGQIVVPAEARKDFNINAGDKLLILGDLDQGIAIVTVSQIETLMSGSAYFLKMMQSELHGKDESAKKG